MITDTVPEALARAQHNFAAHIRNPDKTAPPEGIEDRRMAIYRDLFFNNIKGFLSGNFPVLKSLYDEKAWTGLCRDFYSEYRCHTPLFPQLPREFLQYLQDFRKSRADDPPFMLELAHYEWVELALALDEAELDDVEARPHSDLLSDIPVLSPLAWPLSYQYPVHQISADFQPETAPEEPTHLLVWRQRDYQVKFMLLNEISLLLLQQMKEEPNRSGLELLTAVAGIINHPKPEVVVEGGKKLLEDLREKQIITGVRQS